MYFDARVFFKNYLKNKMEMPTLFTYEDLMMSLEMWVLKWHGKKRIDMKEFGLGCPIHWCSNTEPKELSGEEIEKWKFVFEVIFNEA